MAHEKIRPIAMEQRYLNVIIYGDPGVGKTPLIGTTAKGLILDADIGTESAALQGSKCDVWTVETWQDIFDAYEHLRHGGVDDYDWVWLDSATLMQEAGMDDIMEDVVANKPHRDPDVPDRHEYLKNQQRILKFVRHMKGLPINFGMTAHPMRIEDDDGEVTYMPMITGKQGGLSKQICGYMNVVGHLRIVESKKSGQTHQVLATKRRGKYYAKDRFGVIGEMKDPTIPKLMSKVESVLPGPEKKVARKKVTKKKTTRKRRKP